MSTPVVIEFRSAGLQGVANAFQKAGDAAAKAAEKAQKATEKAQKTAERAAKTAQAAADKQQKATDKANTPAPIKFPSGPNQLYKKLQEKYNQAIIMGNTAAQDDIKMAMDRAQKKINGPDKLTLGQKVGNVLKSSRVSSDGNLMPLVGQLAGLSEAGGPIMALAAAGIAASIGIYKLAEGASEAARKFSELQFSTGSTGATASTLGGIGNSIGLSNEAVGSASASLSERLRSDPQAMAYAIGMGIGVALPRPYDTVNEGGRLLQVIEALRKITNFEDKVRTAHALGVESLLPATNMSDKQFDFVKKNASIPSQIFGPDFQTEAADFASSLSELGKAFGNLMAVAGRPLMVQLTGVFNSLAEGINQFAQTLASIPMNQLMAVLDIIEASVMAFVNPLGAAGKLGDAYKEWNTKSDTHAEALDRNSNATQANTDALQQMNGIFGNGQRLNAAYGNGNVGGEYLRQALQQGGFRMGAF